LLATLVGSDPADEPAPRGTPLLVACSLAALALVGLALVWDVPRATSYATMGRFEWFWRDGIAKQVTGWSMFGLATASCLFSLRKRLPSLRRLGDVGRWRAAHALVALIAAGGLVLHTGLRMGQNLDRWLALGFAAVLALGALAGLIIGAERSADSSCIRSARVWSLRLHLGAVSLLVPLAAFHIIKVYRW
jgi:nitrite reductase (NADH) large subunit